MLVRSIRRNAATLTLALGLAFAMPAALPAASPAPIAAAVAPIKIGGVLKDSRVWSTYRERFVDSSGRVVDTGNGDISHSEGQGYGMLLAVAADDRPTFERLLSWTRANLLVRDDQLAAWRWSGAKPTGTDRNNATDGDLLIAWALAEAADQWNDSGYLAQSRAITRDLVREALRPVDGRGIVIMPGVRGFSAKDQPDGPIVNLSYWIFPAFARLAEVDAEFDWNGLAATGLDLIDKSGVGPHRLPPDWISLAKDPIAPAEGFEKRFGYDALRIPLYLFWANDANRARSSVFADAWPEAAGGVRLMPLTDAPPETAELTEPGYRAVAALARCAASDIRYPDEFYRFHGDQNYYPATLQALSLIAATARGGPCLDRAAMQTLVSASWRPTPGSLARLNAPADPIAIARPGSAVPTSSPIPAPVSRMFSDAQALAKVDTAVTRASLSWTLLIGGGLLIAGLAYFGGRRHARRAAPPDVKEKEIADAVSAVSQAMGKPRLRIAPRTLPISPFAPSSDPGALGRQIEIAAEACVRLDSKIGLIYFEPPAIADTRKAQGDAAANVIVASLAAELRRWLRAADHVEVINQNQIVCCICPLETRQDLESVSKRMCAIVRRMGLAGNGALEAPVPAGLAMYPVDGYSGEELIETARRDYYRNEETLAGAPMIEHRGTPTARDQKRLKPPRKPKSSRKPAPTNNPVHRS
jgi:endoglucanase